MRFGEKLTKKAKNYFSLNRLIAFYSSFFEIIYDAKPTELDLNLMADVKIFKYLFFIFL